MPEDNHFVFIMPILHWTIYSSAVMKSIINQNRRKGHVTRELNGEFARPNHINSAIATNDPKLLWGIGHGGPDIFTVECRTPYMQVSPPMNMDKVKGRVVHLNSCLTALELGPAIISAGALTYYGSNRSFHFYVGSPPNTDRASKAVFLPEHQVEASLLSNKTTGEARADQLARYDEEIDYWTTGGGKNHPGAWAILDCLYIDRDCSVMLGDPNVIVSTGREIPLWQRVAELAAGITPIAVVGGAVLSDQLSRPKIRR